MINQDSLCITQFVIRRKRVTMAMVCDGIGSFAHSEDASCFVSEWMVNWIYRDGLRAIGKFKELGFVRDTFEKICRLVDVLSFIGSDSGF